MLPALQKFWCRRHYFVVRDNFVGNETERIVIGIEHRLVRRVPGVGADCLHRRPKGKEEKVRPTIDVPPQQFDLDTVWMSSIVFDASLEQMPIEPHCVC